MYLPDAGKLFSVSDQATFRNGKVAWPHFSLPSTPLVESKKTLGDVRTADIAVSRPSIVRCVLPLTLDELLVASVVAEEERGHRACRRVTRRSEMAIDEAGRRARRHGHARNAGRISRRLCRAWWKGNDEVAEHAAATTRP